MRRILALIGFLLGLAGPAAAQDAASVLLPRINSLRASQGLPAYAPHASLTAAANNHARWMADTGEIEHVQSSGSGPRTRAVNAGFPSNWISENIYLGASALSAWEWWLNSPVHYAGMVSPNYDRIGIGSASGGRGNAYVLVFGNSTGRLPEAGASASSGEVRSALAGPPSYVLGLDEYGNIKHQIQPAQTIGDIALIYGYTWDDIPYMLELNGKLWDDIRRLQPGEVFLVPPQNGTYTPIPATPTMTATAAATEAVLAATDIPGSPMPTASATMTAWTEPTREIHVAPVVTASPQPLESVDKTTAAASVGQVFLLGLAILLQLGIIGGAGIAYWRRFHSSRTASARSVKSLT